VQLLHVDDDGPRTGSRAFVLLHGFTLDHATWQPVRDSLRRFGRTLAVDLIGHGQSPAPEDVGAYTMTACLEQLDTVLERAGLSGAWAVGYSMGARVALQWAVHRRHRVRGLILESGTAGLESGQERLNRQVLDDALAARIIKGGVKAFVEEWLEQPLFAGLKKLPPAEQEALKERRLLNRTVGLVNSLRGMGAGAMAPVWAELPNLLMPTLLLAGENDPKYAALARRMAGFIPGSRCAIIPGSGHTVHVEQPQAWSAAVAAFLETTVERG
jgi:2-succinyl-6-hydroxy-2,4-cyclohexadiene-1-carboxylate synthase